MRRRSSCMIDFQGIPQTEYCSMISRGEFDFYCCCSVQKSNSNLKLGIPNSSLIRFPSNSIDALVRRMLLRSYSFPLRSSLRNRYRCSVLLLLRQFCFQVVVVVLFGFRFQWKQDYSGLMQIKCVGDFEKSLLESKKKRRRKRDQFIQANCMKLQSKMPMKISFE